MSDSRTLYRRCECCGSHTLGDASESCPLCYWTSAQSDYALEEARENVREHGVIYRPSDRRFAVVRHPILGASGETAIDRVALRERTYREFALAMKRAPDAAALSERLAALLAIVRASDTLYRKDG